MKHGAGGSYHPTGRFPYIRVMPRPAVTAIEHSRRLASLRAFITEHGHRPAAKDSPALHYWSLNLLKNNRYHGIPDWILQRHEDLLDNSLTARWKRGHEKLTALLTGQPSTSSPARARAWMNSQIHHRRNGRLNTAQQAALDLIPPDWEDRLVVAGRERRDRTTRPEELQARISELRRFVAHHGRLPGAHRPGEHALHDWAWRRRISPNTPDDVAEQIAEILDNSLTARWKSALDTAAAMLAGERVASRTRVRQWIIEQRGEADRGRLNRSQVAALAALPPVKPGRMYRVGNAPNLYGANADRSTRAAARTVHQARAALAGTNTAEQGEILRVRAEHPTDDLRRLADRCGMTKDAYASALRRALRKAERV